MDGSIVNVTDQVFPQVVAILAAQALREPSGLTRETTLDSLGIDSLGMAEILFALEESFDVVMPFNANAPDAEVLDLCSVGSVSDAVERLILAQKG